MNTDIFKRFNLVFFIKFAVAFYALHFISTAAIGVTMPGNYYFPFVANYLNFPNWIQTTVLNGASWIGSIFGVQSEVIGNRLTSASGMSELRMWWPCYGLMLKSFWIAFVIAHNDTVKAKLKWIVIGVATILFINIWRVALLLVSMERGWDIGEFLSTNNHDLFNYVSYAVMIGLILYYKHYISNITAQSPAAATNG